MTKIKLSQLALSLAAAALFTGCSTQSTTDQSTGDAASSSRSGAAQAAGVRPPSRGTATTSGSGAQETSANPDATTNSVRNDFRRMTPQSRLYRPAVPGMN